MLAIPSQARRGHLERGLVSPMWYIVPSYQLPFQKGTLLSAQHMVPSYIGCLGDISTLAKIGSIFPVTQVLTSYSVFFSFSVFTQHRGGPWSNSMNVFLEYNLGDCNYNIKGS